MTPVSSLRASLKSERSSKELPLGISESAKSKALAFNAFSEKGSGKGEKGSVLDIDTCSAQSHPPGTGPSSELRDQRGVCEGVVGGVQRTRVVSAVCGGWFGCWR